MTGRAGTFGVKAGDDRADTQGDDVSRRVDPMEADQPRSTTWRVALTLGCLALVVVVAFLDSRASQIAFSIFYVVPIAIAAWYGNRVTGLVIAIVSSLGGLAADLVSIHNHLFFTLVNLGCRLVLLVLIATLVSRLKQTRDREQHLAELEHEAAERLQELNDIKDKLMRSVIVGAREPLGDIYARIVTLGTPVVGGPKYTLAAAFYRRQGVDLDALEEQIAEREKLAIERPITAIYSRRDGVVAWQACIDRSNPSVHHVEVGTTHAGLGFNPEVYALVARALDPRATAQQTGASASRA